ncbi:hypothetical protein M404DRAFT_141899, partial [Pisolithus tinctorius Marx 270]
YDHLITLAEEVTYIWARPKHASAILFLVNRYLGCLSTIAQAVVLLIVLSPEVRLIWLVAFVSDLIRMFRNFCPQRCGLIFCDVGHALTDVHSCPLLHPIPVPVGVVASGTSTTVKYCSSRIKSSCAVRSCIIQGHANRRDSHLALWQCFS